MRTLVWIALLSFLSCSSVYVHQKDSPARFDRPDEAAAFYASKRGIGDGFDAPARYAAATKQIERMARYSTVDDRVIAKPRDGRAVAEAETSGVTPWTELGPGNIGGRTRALVFDPRDANVMYAGAVSGGVWKTTDGGTRWSASGDVMTTLAIGALAIDEKSPDVLYAGTGEGYYREDVRGTALPLRGDGIFVTSDGAKTWQQLAATASNDDFQWVNDLVLSRLDSSRLYAATRTGVWRSLDRGTTWKCVLPATVKGGCLDLALRSDPSGDYLFASCGVFEQATVYRNKAAETAATWEPVLSETGMSRTSLAIAPSRPSTMYAIAAGNTAMPGTTSTQNLLAVYRSDRDGDAGSWTAVTSAATADAFTRTLLSNTLYAVACSGEEISWIPMGWHCNAIGVDPTDPERVWAGGVDLFRSDDGGRTWAMASYWSIDEAKPAYVHADQHVIAFHPKYDGAQNRTLLVANDAGVFRTDDATGSLASGVRSLCSVQNNLKWRSLIHNYGATQFYHGAVSPDGSRLIGGAQDNGTVIGSPGGPDAWTAVWGGDGGNVAFDPVSPSILYAESQNGVLVKSVNGGATVKKLPLTGAGTSSFLFVTPFALDPSQHARLWVAGDRIWRSDDSGGAFVAASASLGTKGSALAIAPANSDRVLVGTNTGKIFRSSSATSSGSTTVWASSTPRSGFVSSIAFDPVLPDLVYATYARFGGAHVWRSLDGGATWSSLDGSGATAIPDIPVHSIAPDPTRPGRIHLGTDLGVFVSLDYGATWMREGSGLPAAVVETVTIARGPYGKAVYAFTHGRGVWRADLVLGGARRRVAR